MKNNIQGVGVALVTPLNRDSKPDFAALEKLVDYVSNNGVDYIVALGTTAETPALTEAEKAEILACIKKANKKKLPLVVGIGGNDTADVVSMINEADFDDVDAILSVTPYYNKPSQRGLYEHYKVVAAASPVPVILYNVPGRTGLNMTAETTIKIAREIPNVLGIKEACGSVSQMAQLLSERPEGFLIISGDDLLAVPLVAIGGDGVISVAANCYPEAFCSMVKAAYQGDRKRVSDLHVRLSEAIETLFTEGNPTGVKAALTIKGVIENNLRLPLISASEVLMEKTEALIKKHNI